MVWRQSECLWNGIHGAQMLVHRDYIGKAQGMRHKV